MLTALKRVKKRIHKAARRKTGDMFQNQDSRFAVEDFEVIRQGIDEVGPKTFVEIGTGRGYATEMIVDHLTRHFPECEFYTIEIFGPLADEAAKRYAHNERVHVLKGLALTREDTTNPAHEELASYTGPGNQLHEAIKQLSGKPIDVAFIDSRKGSALAEFRLIAKHLAPNGIIFVHDIANWGKAVEVLMYAQDHKNDWDYHVYDTGSRAGITHFKKKAG